jgi:predicted kinase
MDKTAPPTSVPLVLMVGPPAAGKSTWAAARFPVDQLFGFDPMRRLLTGDVGDQSATQAAGDMLRVLVDFRMKTDRTTVVDATNTSAANRDELMFAAAAANRPTVAVLMHTPMSVCLERNAARGPDRPAPWPGANNLRVPDKIIRNAWAAVHSEPPTVDDVDLLVHVHPRDQGRAHAQPGRRRTRAWCEQLLAGAGWGRGIVLLDPGAALSWDQVEAGHA